MASLILYGGSGFPVAMIEAESPPTSLPGRMASWAKPFSYEFFFMQLDMDARPSFSLNRRQKLHIKRISLTAGEANVRKLLGKG
jgi:hypothetical protein